MSDSKLSCSYARWVDVCVCVCLRVVGWVGAEKKGEEKALSFLDA